MFRKDIGKKLSSLTTKPSRVNQIDKDGVPPSGPGLSISEGDEKEQKQKRKNATAAEEKQRAAEQMAAEQKKKDAAEAEEKRLAAEQMAAEKKKIAAAAATDRQRQAFKQLSELPDAVSLNQGIPVGLDDQKTVSVPIGHVAIDELTDFEIALAKPKNSSMELVKSEADGDRSWVIEVTEDTLDKKNVKKTLAKIYFKKGDGETSTSELVIKPVSVGVAKLPEYKLLLRSALLLFAKEPKGINKAVANKGEKTPGAKKDKSPKPKQINLVEATRGQSDSVKIIINQNTTKIGLGVPRILISDSGKQTLSIDDLNIAIEVVSPCALNGQKGETTTAVTEKLEVSGHPDGDKRYQVPIFENDLIRFFLTLDAQFEKNILGGRLLWEVNPKLPPDRAAALKNSHQSVLLVSDDKKFEQAKKRQIANWKSGFDKLCDYGSYPKAATASPQAFSTYVQQQLSFVYPDVLQQVLRERNESSMDGLLLKVAAEISEAISLVNITASAESAIGLATRTRITKTTQQLQTEWTTAGQQVFERSYVPLLKSLFIVSVEKHSKTMDEQRAKLILLGRAPTKIHLKKIRTDAFHDGERYEIVLVDENAKPAGNSGHGKQNAATLD